MPRPSENVPPLVRILVLGGTTGIGEDFVRMAREPHYQLRAGGWVGVVGSGLEDDFDARNADQLITLLEQFRPTHIVHSVGVNTLDWTRDLTRGTFDDLMSTNVWTLLLLIRELAVMDSRHKLPSKPSIVSVTSDAAWRPMRTSAIYCASKAAQEMVIRVASREHAPAGWRINGVAPGKVAGTPMTDEVDRAVLELRGWTQEYAEQYERNSSALGRSVTKREVSQVIWDVLFGPAALTGEIIAVNGGR